METDLPKKPDSTVTNLQSGPHACTSSNKIEISEAESALRLLLKVVDSNEEFMLSCENRRLLEILGLKSQSCWSWYMHVAHFAGLLLWNRVFLANQSPLMNAHAPGLK
jgi:hypothetical protein